VWDAVAGRLFPVIDAGRTLDRLLSRTVPAQVVAQIDDSVNLLAKINNVGVVTELAGVVLLIILFACRIVRGPAVILDTQGRGLGQEFGYLGPFLAAALMASYVMYGFDTAGSLAEETHEPRRNAPRAILLALASAAVAGALLMLFGMMAVSDVRADALSQPNGGLGFSLATPDPLYVWGNYNCQNASYLGTTNTSATVPCALMSDALTILSSSWSDSASTASYTTRPAANTTINAALVTGVVPSTGTTTTTFSGGVHNLPRLLEDWNSPSVKTLTLNTSIINLFNSTIATGKFVFPGTYYDPPTRQFSYDLNYSNPNKVPPGIPCALIALRWNWASPPPNTLTYSVIY